jgi:hypothetical protein
VSAPLGAEEAEAAAVEAVAEAEAGAVEAVAEAGARAPEAEAGLQAEAAAGERVPGEAVAEWPPAAAEEAPGWNRRSSRASAAA